MAAIRTTSPVRTLDASELGYGVVQAAEGHASNRPDEPVASIEDPIVQEVLKLKELYGGVIFTGPPGTSKSWSAAHVASALTDGDKDRSEFVQFHPSYQYEDFIQGYVPRKDGSGFDLHDKYFVEMCWTARRDPDRQYVLVIDELSRGDPGRVFGEALTYVERSKRGLEFALASGDKCVVPTNLFILATMNPLDRGVDEVDAAFERRFAKIAMEPSEVALRNVLARNEVEEGLVESVVTFFKALQGKARRNPHAAVGHTFFMDVKTIEDVLDVWKYQLRFLIERAHRLDPDAGADIKVLFERLFGAAESRSDSAFDVGVQSATPAASSENQMTNGGTGQTPARSASERDPDASAEKSDDELLDGGSP